MIAKDTGTILRRHSLQSAGVAATATLLVRVARREPNS
jgi:hypothetical protein